VRIILALVAALAALGTTPARAAAPVDAGKVYSGPDGEEVALIPLTPREGKKFLVRVQGTGSDFDGKVLPHETNDWSSSTQVRISYYTQRGGRDYSTLVVRGSSYELYVPGRRDGIPVKYDEARTQKLKPEDVYAQYQKQDKDGTLAKLMAFDRKGEMARHDSELAGQLKALNASCGATVAAAIDWSTVSDELLKGYSISSFCGTPLESLKSLCDVSDEARRTVQAKVKQLDCRFGTALEPRMESARVVWTTATDVANQGEAATRFFKKNL
jgi:hypothetical protein